MKKMLKTAIIAKNCILFSFHFFPAIFSVLIRAPELIYIINSNDILYDSPQFFKNTFHKSEYFSRKLRITNFKF